MKMMVVVNGGVTMVDALRETEMVIEVGVEEAGDRNVVTVYQAMGTGVPLVQKRFLGRWSVLRRTPERR
eukprot:TRINITY_DN3503_c0_g1_i1.p3 TRINITY_DN3503_c0_g1~~TRINITY_DN3503_c0_g1_i1.p3  ORF type:complete len:69 (-),score=8.27 TRINITY_DN3503_c0_g1_i1:222-428(-)